MAEKIHKYVLLAWSDACIVADPTPAEQLGELTEIISCGLLVREDVGSITIAQEYHKDDGKYRDSTTIPKSCILWKKSLKIGK